MAFKRNRQRYGDTPAPETPFQRAGQLWDERIGSARVQARNWRVMAFGGLALSGAMAAALVWQGAQSRVTPYVVEIDRLGEARAVSEAEKQYRPTDPQIAWQLAHFIEEVRSVSLDPVLMRRGWLAAYDMVTARGAVALSDYARTAAPFAGGEKTVAVEVTSVVRASDKSFAVKWIETAFDRGVRTGDAHWTAILTIKLQPPTTADVLRRNPLGLYIDGFDWTRELEPMAGGSAPASGSSLTPATAPRPNSSAAQRAPVSPSDQEMPL